MAIIVIALVFAWVLYSRSPKWGIWLLALLGLILFALPLGQVIAPDSKLVTNALLFSFTQMFVLIVLSSNWNLTGGFTGYIDFGHAVFFGLGAYGTVIMMVKVGWPFLPALLVGAVAAAIFAVLIGSATLRLKGPYFSIAMLGTFAAMREAARIAKPLTNGSVGLYLKPYVNRPLFYYVMLSLAVAVVGMMAWIRRSEFGATLVAIREDEVGAEMRGINTTLHKITAFWIAAFSTGLVGGLWGFQNTYVDPGVVFVQDRTIDLVMMSMLGGLGTIGGPVIGAASIYWLRDVVWANFLDLHLLIQGILLIVIVLFVPEGIMGTLGDGSATSLEKIVRGWFQPKREEVHP